MLQGQLSKKSVAFFGLSGLTSGLITSILIGPNGQEARLSLGAVFGLFLVFCLSAPFFIDSPFKTIGKGVIMILSTTGTYFLSVYAAMSLQLGFPGIVPTEERWSMGTNEPASAVALLVGGVIGGFLVFSAAFLLFGPRIRKNDLVRSALLGAAIGGVLGFAGWALRSSFGVAVWYLLHAFHLTPALEDSPRQWFGSEYDYRETTRMFSLYVVWQTGISTALGIMLQAHPIAADEAE